MRRALVCCERGLLAVAAVSFAVYGLACARTSYVQSRESAAFDSAREAALRSGVLAETDRSEWSAQRIAAFERALETADTDGFAALARLEIPAAGVSVMVLPGTDDKTLDLAVGHIEGTALPGESGNIGIAGHRDGFFRGLRKLKPGDALSLTHLGGVVHYRVEDLRVVAPTAVEVLEPTGDEVLTLVTCFPFYYVGDAPQRFVVHARALP